MRACPFCGFNEGWVYPYSEDNIFIPKTDVRATHRVVCVVCGSEGPPATSAEMAEKKWDGLLKKPRFKDPKEFKKALKEMDGGVSSPMSTLTNTPGMGNAQPASQAAMTGAQQTADSAKGSGDRWDASIGKPATQAANESLNEMNLNPYDKIGMMMAKKLGVELPFKKKDSRTNTIKQRNWEELDEDQEKSPESIDDYVKDPDKVFRNAKKRKVGKTNESRFELETLDNYIKASKHVPDHPLTLVKKTMIKEEDLRTEEVTKDIKAKEALEKLGIAFEYKPAKSGKNRVFIKDPMKDVLSKLKEGGWEEYGKNPENTIRKYTKEDRILTIFADGKDLPRATLTPKSQEAAKEHAVVRKVVPGSINPYLKS